MMHVGVNLGFGNLHEDMSDHRMVESELRLAELADRLGYDSVWAVEFQVIVPNVDDPRPSSQVSICLAETTGTPALWAADTICCADTSLVSPSGQVVPQLL